MELMKALGSIAILLFASTAAAMGAEAGAEIARKLFHWRPFFAPFHSVVLHFPIGFLTMAGILEVYHAAVPSRDVRRVTALALWLGLLTGVLSAGLGLMRAGGGDYDTKMLESHRLYGIAVPFVTAAALALQRLAYREQQSRGWARLYRGVLAATLALVVAAGHLGGNLTHGSKYLVENAPEFVRELLDETEPPSSNTQDVTLDARQRHYVEKVRPLLEAKCYKCHGPEKQKGGYRLDQPSLALKGGASGHVAIQPGDPMGSHLVRLILLPPQHDDAMPPEGKQPLTMEEIMTVLEWIRNGAAFPPGETNQASAGGG